MGRVLPRAPKNDIQLNPMWLMAATRPKTSRSPIAGRQRSPIPKWTSSEANSAIPTPNGTPHMSASRFDFTNASNSSSVRSFTRQMAG